MYLFEGAVVYRSEDIVYGLMHRSHGKEKELPMTP